MPKIEGKIIRILSNQRVIIDVGIEQGVKSGMIFKIASEAEMIKDPVTGKDIEKLEIIKGEVIAQHVQNKFTICETPLINDYAVTLAALFGYSSSTKRASLIVDQKEITPLSDSAVVKVGDIVICQVADVIK